LGGRDAGEQVGRHLEEPLLRPGGAGEAAAGLVAEAAEHGGGVLERLALEQTGEEEVALLPERQLLVELDVVPTWQEAAGLELDERGGDEQELGGDVEVEGALGLAHPVELGQVGVDDAREGDLVE